MPPPSVKDPTAYGIDSKAGHVLMPLHLVTIAPKNFFSDADRKKLFAFGKQLVKSNWLREVTKGYYAGPTTGTHTAITGADLVMPDQCPCLPPDPCPPPCPYLKKENAEKYIETEITKHPEIAHSGHNVYALLMPPGILAEFKPGSTSKPPSGFHSGFNHLGREAFAKGDNWAAIQPDVSHFTPENFDRFTTIISHETIEAITDNAGDGYRIRFDATKPAWQQSPVFVAVHSLNPEIADLCGGARIIEAGYVFERILAKAPPTSDPCVPAAPNHYFNTSPPVASGHEVFVSSWTAANGTTATITVRGWGHVKGSCTVPDWKISAEAVQVSEPGSFVPSLAANALSASTIGLGRDVTLKVKIPSGTRKGSWGVVRVTSTPPQPPARGDDERTEWYYGVYVPPS